MKYVGTYVFVVLIKELRHETVEVARVFSKRSDAELFIKACEEAEPSGNYGYRIDQVELDGDPNGCY